MSVFDSILVGIFGLSVVFIVLVGLSLLVRLQSSLIGGVNKKKQSAAVPTEENTADETISEPAPELPPGNGYTEDEGEFVVSPGPGTVLDVKVVVGAHVKRGDLLLLLDAMDMEFAIDATKDGTVKRIMISEGDYVSIGMPLVEID